MFSISVPYAAECRQNAGSLTSLCKILMMFYIMLVTFQTRTTGLGNVQFNTALSNKWFTLEDYAGTMISIINQHFI